MLVETLLGLPLDAVPLAAAAVVLVGLSLLAARAWSRRGLPATVDWLMAGGAPTASTKRAPRK